MSKRSRRTKDETRPANDRAPAAANASEARPSDHGHVEPTLVASGAAFQIFDAWIDSQLDELVGRWLTPQLRLRRWSGELFRRPVGTNRRNGHA